MKTLLEQLRLIYKVDYNNWVKIVDQNNELIIKCPIQAFNELVLIPDLMESTNYQVVSISSNVYTITVSR